MKEGPNRQGNRMDFSVAMCVYGGDNAEYFDAAINSVIEQSRKPSELVITVDGPIPDSIGEVLEKYKVLLNGGDIKYKVIRLEKNLGHVDEVGGYIDWFCNEDYYLWIRLALANKIFANINDCLVKMRIDEKSYKRRGGLKYYKSEKKIQRLMLTNGMISKNEYLMNIAKRFVVQVCLPNNLRRIAFNLFARE